MSSAPELHASARDLAAFIAASPTAAHAVATTVQRLEAAGFVRLQEGAAWTLTPGQRFYAVRQGTSLVAGVLGAVPPAEGGLRLLGAHTDSPGLRLKPHALYASGGYQQLGVEVYGGPLLASWFDRDLTLAGQLLVRAGSELRVVLVRGDRPLCRVPQVAIHFNREVNEAGLKVDKQRHLPPLLGLDLGSDAEPTLRRLLAEWAQVEQGAIVSWSLELVDVQPPALFGLREELLAAPRIDNLAGCHAALQALLDVAGPLPSTRLMALFDGEEVGSQTVGGAGSQFLDNVIERLCLQGASSREALHRALARARLVSVDGAHGVHPNFADYHDPHHRTLLGGGPVIKVNAQQRYATGLQSAAWFEASAATAGVQVQHYVHRTDLACGSTIGPMTATRLGVDTVDVGIPMLAMHSLRETAAASDQGAMVACLGAHLRAAEPG